MTSTASQPIPTDLLPKLVEIEGGTFEMGSNDYDSEKPIHSVQVSSFHLAKYPVTTVQYAAFLNAYQSRTVKAGPYAGEELLYTDYRGVEEKGGVWQAAEGFEQHPMIYVSWYGSETYCQWLSEQTGERYRLPSEAEWEYSAKGGRYNSSYQYAGSNHLDEVGWYSSNSHDQTKPVGLKYPNQLGLFDISGNVWEWCADRWHKNYKGVPKDATAWIGGEDEKRRVVRGGSWGSSDVSCRVSYRGRFFANVRDYYVGFRVSRY